MKRFLKTLILLSLTVFLLMSIASCRNFKNDNNDQNEQTTVSSETTAPEETTPPDTHVHTEEILKGKAPTCTEAGQSDGKYCSTCNEILVAQKTLEALGHDEISHEAKAPTCTETGWDAYITCSRCTYTTKLEKDTVDHNYKWVVDTQPSFDNEGVKHEECTVCHDKRNENTSIDKLTCTHNFTKAEATAATCLTAGNKEYYTCSICNKVYVDANGTIETTVEDCVTPALGHTAGAAATCTTPQTCSRCDYVFQKAIGHNIVIDEAIAATCIKTGLTEGSHCSRCNDATVARQVTNALGHNIVIDKAVAATCTEAGLTEGSHCSRCNDATTEQQVIDSLGHNYEWVVDIQPTFDSEGVKHEECTVCHDKRNENAPIDKITCTHNLKKTEAIDATCLTAGNKEYYTCSICHKVYSNAEGTLETTPENSIIAALGHTAGAAATCTTPRTCIRCDHAFQAALGHNIIIDAAVAATCTEAGLTEGSHCSRCNDATVAQQVTNALGHDIIIDEAIAATCTATGLTEGQHCSRCNDATVARQITNALGHDIVIDRAVAATCTTTGLTEGSHCSRCNDATTEQQVTDALGHDIIIDKAVAATCTTTGLTEGSHCSRCNDATTEQQVTNALGHNAGAAATCTTAQMCTRCDYVFQPALGHDYTETVDNTLRSTATTCQEFNTYWYDCSRCGNTAKNDINATDKYYTSNIAGDHIMFDVWTTENEQHFHKCAVSGCDYVEDKADCFGGTADCTKAAQCSACGKEYGTGLGHDYTETIDNTIRSTATYCQEFNTYWYDCSRCGNTAKNDINATDKYYTSNIAGNHIMFDAWTTENEQHFHKCAVNGCDYVEDKADCFGGVATCTEVAKCSVCGKKYGTALGHDIVIDAAVAATCTEAGLTEGSHCSRCDAATVAQQITNPLGHTWQDATCIAPKTCSVCNATQGGIGNHPISNTGICSACGQNFVRTIAFFGGKLASGTYTGDNAEIVDSVSGIVGEEIPLPTPQMSNYNFEGWYLDYECTVPFTGTTFSEDLTLYAKWVSNTNQTISIMSFNINNEASGGAGNIVSFITSNSPDIICIQEAGASWMTSAANGKFSGYSGAYWNKTGDTGEKSGLSNVIYYRTDKFTAVASNARWLSKNSGTVGSVYSYTENEITYTANSPCYLHYFVLQRKSDGALFAIINTQFDIDGKNSHVVAEEIRRAEVDFLMTQVKGIQDSRGLMPIIVVGDFNATPDSTAYNGMTNSYGYFDSSIIAKQSEIKNTFTGNGGSILDYVFVSSNLQYAIESYNVYETNTSDHNAIIVKIAIPNLCSHKLTKTEATDATCTTTGNKEYYTCSICNKVYVDAKATVETTAAACIIPALGHNYNEVITAPTCENDGYTTYTCSVCGDVYTDNKTDAIGHAWTNACDTQCDNSCGKTRIIEHDYEWIIDTQPTLTTEGIKHEECTVCHNKRNENTPVDTLTCNHSLTKTEAIDATCATTGNKEYYTCSICNKVYSNEEGTLETTVENCVIPALGHTWKDATCIVPKTCSTCGEVDGVASAEHAINNEGICNVCGKSFVRVIDFFGGKLASGTYTGDNAQIASPVSGIIGTEIPLPTPQMSNYNFEGWYLDYECTVPFTGTTFSENLTLYAKWTSNTAEQLTILSFNVNQPGSGANASKVIDAIKANSPDIVCIQEADKTFLNTLTGSLSGYSSAYQNVTSNNGKNKDGLFNAIFVKSATLTASSSNARWPAGGEGGNKVSYVENGITYTANSSTYVHYLIVTRKSDGQVFAVVNTQFDNDGKNSHAVGEKIRQKELAYLLSQLKGITDGRGNVGIIVVGDFNATSDSTAYNGMTETYGYFDASQIAKQSTIKNTFGNSIIDYVFVSPNLQSFVESYNVYETDSSDHHALIVKIALPAACAHRFTKTEATDATCLTAGNKEYYTCSICGKVYADVNGTIETTVENCVTPALGHNAGADATCTAAQTCTGCGYVFVEALGHNIIVDEAVAATCTKAGLTEGSHCSRCDGATVAQQVTDALGHEGGAAATCTTAQTCIRCDYVFVEALGHDIVVDAAVAATCTETGLTQGYHCSKCDGASVAQQVIDALGHTAGAAATCTTAQSCIRCNYVFVEALGHDIVTDEAVAATCTTTGLTEGSHCSRCDDVTVAQQITNPLGHTYEWVVDIQPTFESEGVKHQECKVCHDKQNENAPIEKLTCTHDFKKTEAIAATCLTTGTKEYYTCSICNRVYSNAEGTLETTPEECVIAALGHDTVPHAEKAPNCTEIGWETYETCSRCDYTTYVEKAALGHDEQSHKAKAPTCTEIGWEAYETCSKCDYTTYTELAPLGHDAVPHAEKAPTCTEIGWEAYETCSRCDYTTYVEKAALGHDEQSHKAKAPTCTEIGWKAYETCSRCDYTTYAEEVALGHNIVIDEAVAATCTVTGLTEGSHCSRCDGATVTQQVTNALGHTWQDATCVVPQTCSVCNVTRGEPIEHQISNTGDCNVCGQNFVRTITFFGGKLASGTYSGDNTQIAAPISGIVGEEIPLPTPQMSNYNFEGWYLDYACTTPLTETTFAKDLTLYAKWASNTHQTISIMSFNINNEASNGAGNIVSTITSNSPDIVCVQEAGTSWMTAAANGKLSGYSGAYWNKTGDTGENSGLANAIFYKTDKFTVVTSTARWLTPGQPGSSAVYSYTENGTTYTANSPCYLHYFVLQRKSDGAYFAIINTQFDNDGKNSHTVAEEIRRAEVDFLMTQIKGIQSGRGLMPVIVVGDFNSTSDGAAYDAITNSYGYFDASAVAKQGEIKNTYTGMKDSGGSILDYVFVSYHLQHAVESYKVCDAKSGGKWLSDHNAIIVKIALPKVCPHTLTKTAATDATCLTVGNKEYYSCSTCKKIYLDARGTKETTPADCIIAALGHHWNDATCIAPKTCSTCGATEGIALAHAWTNACDTECDNGCGTTREIEHNYEWIVDATPTVTTEGIKHEECTVCHNTRNQNTPVDKLTCTHNFTKTEATAATCLTTGNKEYYTCSICNKVYSNAEGTLETTPEDCIIAVLSHDWVNATCTVPATCSMCGGTKGEAMGHSWTDATCTAPQTCSVCGVTRGEPVEHNINKAGICSVCGGYFLRKINFKGGKLASGTYGNDNAEIASSIFGLVGQTISFPSITLQLKGYNFDGWCTDYACTKPFTGTTFSEDLTLYAKWTSNANQIVSVMSFNIKTELWKGTREDRVIATITENAPDVVCVQEADAGWMSALKSKLSSAGYTFVSGSQGRDGGSSGEHTAIFYRTNKFNAISSGTKWLSNSPNTAGSKYSYTENGKTYTSNYPRIMTYVVLERKSDKAQFLIVNTHLDNNDKNSHDVAEKIRQAEVDIMMNIIKDITKSKGNIPVIVTGDFNAIPVNRTAYNAMTQTYGYCDSSRVAKEGEPKTTFTEMTDENSGTILDYIFVSSNLRIYVETYSVCPAKRGGEWVSDHNAIIAKIAIPKV